MVDTRAFVGAPLGFLRQRKAQFIIHANIVSGCMFNVPQITGEMDASISKDISYADLKTALRQMRKEASLGLDGIPITLYLRLIDL